MGRVEEGGDRQSGGTQKQLAVLTSPMTPNKRKQEGGGGVNGWRGARFLGDALVLEEGTLISLVTATFGDFVHSPVPVFLFTRDVML